MCKEIFIKAGLEEFYGKNKLEPLYNHFCKESSDINEHLSNLMLYASKCDSIVELGFRTARSAVSLISGKPKTMISYDIANNWMGIQYPKIIESVVKNDDSNVDWKFIQADVLKIEIPVCDFLFVDTLHTKVQLSQELKLHASKVRKYIGFHDVVSFGRRGEDGSSGGLMDAIENFLYPGTSSFNRLINPNAISNNVNKEWKIEKIWNNNNGLCIIKRIN